MSNIRIGLLGALAMGLAVVGGLTPASGANAQSSPEDRARFVSITRDLEASPFKPSAKDDRAWAIQWLTDAPDVTVKACLTPLGGLGDDYPYAAEITVQYIFAMGTVMIEHPETVKDPNAQQLAGVEGALRAYRSILRDKPEAKSSALEKLAQIQARSELPDFVRKAWSDCSKKK